MGSRACRTRSGVFNVSPGMGENPEFQAAIKRCIPNGMPLSVNEH
jgi:hypothetical protein